MRIEAPRLVLREIAPGDFAAAHAYASLPEVSQHDDWGPNTEQDTLDWLDRAMETAQRLASIPASAFALTKEAFYSPILQRTAQLADLNARVVDAWMQQHTYDTIRAYLDRTIKK